jgi:tetratricopeptide (TPR) repeat protein
MAAAPSIENRALGFRSLGFLALWRGNLVAAADYFRQAVDATAQNHSVLSEARNRLLLASVYRVEDRMAEANQEVDRVVALANGPTIEPAFLGLLAYQCAQLDRRRDADSAAYLARRKARGDNPIDQASVAFADAAALLARQRPDSALSSARRTARFPWPVLRSMVTAEAFRGTNQVDSARVVLREMLSARAFGTEGEIDWLHAPLILGDLLVAAGDTAGAIQRYRGLIDQWRDAPTESPDLVTARARLKTLAAVAR